MSDEAPEGYRWEWVAEGDDWQIGGDGRKCRMKGCQKAADVALKRRRAKSPSGFSWWHYCAFHMYGRKIENGVIKSRRLVEIEEVSA